ncbi:hypothetical protein EG344_21855 [Chryseobacterium sp. G0162]|uniref:hypothetical protein n=1 Tax=unclassified Chryseobacterium TaxID=2593645 RepID=UPI000F50BCC1|nr:MULTISPECIES: hypothetical protein [unclassified Chryseobacterium]AZB11288.1 hypothetical protein EG344_21855 [Chryseobacterium sp. G0162]
MKLVSEILGRKYHLSYDVINCDDDFEGKYEQAKECILICLRRHGATSVKSPCESTIIFIYPNDKFDIEKLGEELKPHFFFSLCLVDKDQKSHHFEKVHRNLELNERLQKMWEDIKSTVKPN